MSKVKSAAHATDAQRMSELWNDTGTAAPFEESGDARPLPLGRPIKRRIGRRLVAVALLGAGCLGLAVHTEVKPYNVTSGSMEPTLHVGDRVMVDPAARVPQAGDIVVFHAPAGAHASDPVCGAIGQGWGTAQPCGLATAQESSAVFIKRVVAGPGDTIAIVDGHAVRDGTTLNEPYIGQCTDQQTCDFPIPVRVPAGEYYMLGDNRGISDDSRFWGPVPSSWIIGTAVSCTLLDTICHARH
jgi:signal peptidase I